MIALGRIEDGDDRYRPRRLRAESGIVTDFPSITRDPAVISDKPCIRGLHVTVGMIVGQIGAGLSVDDVLGDYPYVQHEDILEALRYADRRPQERDVNLAEKC